MLRNLKFKIFISFFGLVLIGMGLLSFMLFALWHNSIVTLQVSHLEYLLVNTKRQFESSQFDSNHINEMPMVKQLLKQELVTCLTLVENGKSSSASQTCIKKGSIEKIIANIREQENNFLIFKQSVFTNYLGGEQTYIAGIELDVGRGGERFLMISGSIKSPYSGLSIGFKVVLVYILVTAFLLAVVGFFRMFKFVIRPLEDIVRLTDQYYDDMSVSLLRKQSFSEFNQVTFSLKQMLKRIDADNLELRSTVSDLQRLNKELHMVRNEVVRAEKLASVGRLSAGLAHEIGNPLGIVKGYLELLDDDCVTPGESRQFIARSQKEVVRIENIIGQLLDCSRIKKVNLVSTNVCEILQELVTLFRDRKLSRKITFEEQFNSSEIYVNADYDSLRQVFLNCLLNSVDAIDEKSDETDGRIIVRVIPKRNEDQQYVVVEIVDNGTGIDSCQKDSVFDPFFTTKEIGKGTGLGLAVSYTLVEQFDGKISLRNRQKGGACVTIEFPYNESLNV